MRTTFFLLTTLLCVSVAGCSDKWAGYEKYETEATVQSRGSFDDCDAFMIAVQRGEFVKLYKPSNLPAKFQIDKLQVEVSYYITEETHNCGFGGYVPVIYIIKIKKI